MPNINEIVQRKSGFFHSLGKVLTESERFAGNEKYKSSHNVMSYEVWMDEIPYAPDFTDAIGVGLSYSDIVNSIGLDLGTSSILYPLSGTNYQTWFLDLGDPEQKSNGFDPSDQWCKPLISPSDVPNEAGAPSFGYEMKIFRPDDSAVNYNNAFFDVDYFAGLVRFDVGKTPIESGITSGLAFQFNKTDFEAAVDKLSYIRNINNNAPRANAFQYVGQTLDNLTLGLSDGPGITISNDDIAVNIGTQSGLTFSQNDELIINIDDETIKINPDNKIYVSGNSVYEWNYSNNTNGDNQPTGITISNTPLNYSTVKVMVNGQVQIVGNSSNYLTSDCYFYDGVSAKDIDDISQGDEIYWNGNITNYNLSTSDKILFIYEF